MRKIIDQEQICTMIEMGIPVRHIASRLGISERQILRIKKTNHIRKTPSIGSILGTSMEWDLWFIWFKSLGSYSLVAYRFGVSRQVVFKQINIRKAKNEKI